jgi:antitoxin (DNA-binding transcriptional repressor) of toxin-antitoxin stability system
MSIIATPEEVQADFPRLLSCVEQGEQVDIVEGGRVVAQIVRGPAAARRKPRFGTAKGLIHIHPGFDDPLSEEELDEIDNNPIFPGR